MPQLRRSETIGIHHGPPKGLPWPRRRLGRTFRHDASWEWSTPPDRRAPSREPRTSPHIREMLELNVFEWSCVSYYLKTLEIWFRGDRSRLDTLRPLWPCGSDV